MNNTLENLYNRLNQIIPVKMQPPKLTLEGLKKKINEPINNPINEGKNILKSIDFYKDLGHGQTFHKYDYNRVYQSIEKCKLEKDESYR